jgi:intracellular multiplication protein IcmE
MATGKKTKNLKVRTWVVLGIVIILTAGCVFGIYYWRRSTVLSSSAQISGPPRIESVPGAGNPSAEYVAKQNIANALAVQRARQRGTSALPTLTRSDFQGDLSALNAGDAQNCAIIASSSNIIRDPQDCSIARLEKARQAGVRAEELRCLGCACPVLKEVGYTAGEMRSAGFNAVDLKNCGFTAEALKNSGFTAKDLKEAGFTAQDLKQAGFTAAELKDAGFTAKELKDAGFTAQDLKQAGFTAAELKDAGFTAQNLKQAGFTAKDLKEAGFTAKELKDAGFTAKDLKRAGFSKKELEDAGYASQEIQEAVADRTVAGSEKDCRPDRLRKAREEGISATQLREQGCGLVALKAAGYTAAELKNAGFTAKQLKDAGFSAQDLKDAGFSAQDLKDAGFSAGELKDAGFTAKQLKDAGFDAKTLREAGYRGDALKEAGFSADALEKAGFSKGDLIRAGFPDQDVDASVDAPQDCSVAELKKAREAGFSVRFLKEKGCPAAALAAAGFTAKQLKDAGFDAKTLREAGFSADALEKAGFSKGDLIRAGFSDQDVDASVNAPQDCSVAELKKAREAGFSVRFLKEKGCPAAALAAAGYNQAELNAAGVGVTGGNGVQTNQNGLPGGSALNQALMSASSAQLPSINNRGDAASINAQLERARQQQAKMMAVQQKQNMLRQLQSQMNGQARQLLNAWSNTQVQQIQEVIIQDSGLNQANQDQSGANNNQDTGAVIKAGTIMFAVLDTDINSDENSPVLATIVAGQLKGSKLIGAFRRQNKRVVLSFTTLSIPSLTNSISMNAVAIDANTAHTALADNVDSHYLLRYGSLFASSFLSGIGSAIQNSGSTDINSFFGVSTTHDKYSVGETIASALGDVGDQWSSAAEDVFNTPPTVTVDVGAGIGILFMQDLKLPEQAVANGIMEQ